MEVGTHTPGNRLLLPCFCLGLLRESASLGPLGSPPLGGCGRGPDVAAALLCASAPSAPCFQEDGWDMGLLGTMLLYCFGLCMAHGRCSVVRICALMGLDPGALAFPDVDHDWGALAFGARIGHRKVSHSQEFHKCKVVVPNILSYK